MEPGEVTERLCQEWAEGSDARLAEYVGAAAASTVWHWRRGEWLKGPTLLLLRYLLENPDARPWFEENAARRREIEGKETPADKRNRARRDSYHRSKGKVEGSLGLPPAETAEPAEKPQRGRKRKALAPDETPSEANEQPQLEDNT